MYDENKITYFAETDFRNQKTRFGIKAKDRSRHMYIIGKTGMGKSTILENMAIQDIQNDEGIIFIDPHGSTAVKLLDYIPKHRVDDVVYFAPHDTDFPIAFNVLEQVPKEKRNAVAGGLMNAFKKIWVDSFSSRMEYLLNYTMLALLDVPGTTLLSINRLLSDKVYRKYIIDRVEDSLVKNFWTTEFERYSTAYATEAVAPIQNKVGQFIASPMIRNIIGQEISNLDFRKCMDEKKIVIINISKGIIGPENMRLLGGMLITKIQLAAMSRANLPSESLEKIPNTYFYVDEFQNFANESFTEILSESRKYKLCLTVANQYMDQMTEEVRAAVIGNVGTLIAYRVGSTDADILEKEFAPQFVAEDMVNLGIYQMYMKLMIDGIGSRPFSARGLPPIIKPSISFAAESVAYSRKHLAGFKSEVEEKIKDWTNKDYALEINAGRERMEGSLGMQAGMNATNYDNRRPSGDRNGNGDRNSDRGNKNNSRNDGRSDTRNDGRSDGRNDGRSENRNNSRNENRNDNRSDNRSSDMRNDSRNQNRNDNRNDNRNTDRDSERSSYSARSTNRNRRDDVAIPEYIDEPRSFQNENRNDNRGEIINESRTERNFGVGVERNRNENRNENRTTQNGDRRPQQKNIRNTDSQNRNTRNPQDRYESTQQSNEEKNERLRRILADAKVDESSDFSEENIFIDLRKNDNEKKETVKKSSRKSAKENMQKIHILSQNTRKKKSDDEVPEDILKALLDTSDI